jgi:hypothetical protein
MSRVNIFKVVLERKCPSATMYSFRAFFCIAVSHQALRMFKDKTDVVELCCLALYHLALHEPNVKFLIAEDGYVNRNVATSTVLWGDHYCVIPFGFVFSLLDLKARKSVLVFG